MPLLIPGCFRGGEGKIRGEASTYYLRSEVAIPALIEQRSSIRIIALVRNPLDMFQSYHNEMAKNLLDDQTDPERAWQIQEQRALGHRIPPKCPEPRMLQYRWICSLGDQIERLCRLVPEAHRRIIVYDDLVRHPSACLDSVFDFLGAERQAISRLPRSNEFAVPRSLRLTDFLLLLRTKTPFRQIRLRVKPAFNNIGIAPFNWLWRANLRAVPKPPLSKTLKATLQAEFAADVAVLGRHLNRDFSAWLH